jgi:hypothetical protein
MGNKIKAGSWVEVYQVVLTPDERAPQVPDDTKKVPLEMRLKGFLTEDASPGDEVEVVTPAGRRVTGKLSVVAPAYDHGFGSPIAELVSIGREVRGIIEKENTGEGEK